MRGSTRRRHVGGVGPGGGLGRGRVVGHDDERLGVVGVVQGGNDRVGRRARVRSGPGVTGGEDAACHRREVRREEHLPADDLLHLGCVTVREQAVRCEVLVHRPEVQRLLQASAGSRDSRRGVDDDAGGLHQAVADQRGQGQSGRGRIAAGRGDQRRPGQAVAEQLGQPVDGFPQQLRRAGAPRRTRSDRERRPSAGSRRPGPRPRRPAPGARGRCAATRRAASRRTPDRGRRSGPDRSPRTPGRGTRRAREGVCTPTVSTYVGMGRGYGDLEVRMPGKEAQQLRPGVARRPEDPDLHRMSIHHPAYSCVPNMQPFRQ